MNSAESILHQDSFIEPFSELYFIFRRNESLHQLIYTIFMQDSYAASNFLSLAETNRGYLWIKANSKDCFITLL